MFNFSKTLLFLLGIFPVLHRGDSVLLLKNILKIRLAGKAEIIADFGQTFIAVGQESFCFF